MTNYNHLSKKERAIISRHYKDKTYKEIGDMIDRPAKTVWQEVKRNKNEDWEYRAFEANGKAKQRRITANKKNNKILSNNKLHKLIKQLLKKWWSPDSIAGRIKKEKEIDITAKTIYNYINQCEPSLKKYLTYINGYKKYETKQWKIDIPEEKRIDNRPKEVDERNRKGDWEADLIIGKNHKSAMLTLIDRKSRYVIMEKLESKKTLETCSKIAINLIKKSKSTGRKFHTLTLDNGKEFMDHELIEKSCDIKVYYCDPYSPRQKWSIENINWIIRNYIPKGADINNWTKKEIGKIQNKINFKPRKKLDYNTPYEVFYNEQTALLR